MNIRTIPISEIQRAKYNPRKPLKPGDPAYDKLKKAVATFGLVEPLVWNSRTKNLVGGHQRLSVLEERGDTQVEVSVVDLSERDEKALNLALNKHSGEWDFASLADMLQELDAGDMDMEVTGFSADELEKLMTWTAPNSGLTDEDTVPEPPKEPVSQTGDLWILGPHRLLCGDARHRPDVERLIAGALINLVVTSPPYASQREYDASSGFRPIPPDEYVEWFLPVAKNIKAILAPDGSYFLNIKPSADGLDTSLYVFDLVLAHVRRCGYHFATEFCWERNGVPKSVTRRFKNQFEPIYQFAAGAWKMRPDAVRHFSEDVPRAGGKGSGNTTWKNAHGEGRDAVVGSFGGAKKRKNGTKETISSVQGVAFDAGEFIGPGMAYPGNRLPTFSGTHDALSHAAAYPVGLPAFFIQAFTDAGDTTFDPFMGSGSTLMAAERLDRIGYGMEISPAYCDVIVQRWEHFTGKKAERA